VKVRFSLLVCFALACLNPSVAEAASPAELISSYRLQHGEGRVITDADLNRIAQAQASAMASRDLLAHDALEPFSSRAASAGARRIAENIAYGNADFPRTLNQWIGSSGHRSNLLMHGASRVGVASAKSSKTGRTYWAMVIAGDYERPKKPGAKSAISKKPGSRKEEECSLRLGSVCLN
jgi:uncharacterized protein YkwD